jgi:hypothetical protein
MTEPKWKTEPTSGRVKPTKVGTYKRKLPFDKRDTYSYWDGIHWKSYVYKYNEAASKMVSSDHQSINWFDVEEYNPELKNIKIRVKDAQESKLVQGKLFEMGYFWSDGKVILFTDYEFLYGYADGRLTSGSSESGFKLHQNQEVVIKTSIELVDAPERTILHNGIEYTKKELTELLSQFDV